MKTRGAGQAGGGRAPYVALDVGQAVPNGLLGALHPGRERGEALVVLHGDTPAGQDADHKPWLPQTGLS